MNLRAALVAVALLSSLPAWAEQVAEIPNPRKHGSWVTDLADVLSPADVTLLDGVIDALERDNGAEIAVVTLRTSDGRPLKDLASELFNAWGVGKEGADNGVLVVLALHERRIEVETGYGAEGVLPDGKVGGILDRHAVPSFRAGQYGAGIVKTVEALATELRKEEPAYSKAARRVGLSLKAVLAMLAALAGALVLAFLFWLSRRPKRCPTCSRPMRLLSEQQENVYLDKDQEFEEHLGAYDWQVWRCDDDKQTVFATRGGWFSGYKTCSACGRKTAQTTSHTLRSASYTSSGTEEVVTTCRLPRCRHTSSYQRTIPRKERPTTTYSSSSSSWSSSSSSWSSSSSSFGGGSSGGGGAGRSW